jgi:hypothetical protein
MADRANDVMRWAAERRMRVKIACLPPGSVDQRMRVQTCYIDDHVTIPQPKDEEEDDDQITPPITPVATQQGASSQDSDAFLTDPGTYDQFYEIRMMVRVGNMTSCNVPARLRGSPESCLVHRRIVRDMEDNDEMLEDTYIVLYTREHFSRRLCSVPHLLEVALILRPPTIQCNSNSRNGHTGRCRENWEQDQGRS